MKLNLILCLLCLWAPSGSANVYREFRIPLPFTLEQYRIGHLWSTAEWSIHNTGGGEGVEIITNEFSAESETPDGRFTYKIYHVASKVPKLTRILAPRGSLEIHEVSWNSFPSLVRTVLSNPDYMKADFYVKTHSRFVENDDCKQDDIFEDIYKGRRDVVNIDIVNDALIMTGDYKTEEDPGKCRSEKLSLGPLNPEWKTKESRMCVYKLVEVKFKWWSLQQAAESRILKACPRLFRLLHRQMFCWADEWAGLSMSDIREFEAITKRELDILRSKGKVRGISEQ